MKYEVGFSYTPGAKTGTPPPGVVRVVSSKKATWDEAFDDFKAVAAALNPLVLLSITKKAELGYEFIGSPRLFIEPVAD